MGSLALPLARETDFHPCLHLPHTHTAAELNVASSRITPFDTLVIVGVFFGSFPAPAFDTAVPTARPVYGSNESGDIQLINVLNGVVSALTSCFN